MNEVFKNRNIKKGDKNYGNGVFYVIIFTLYIFYIKYVMFIIYFIFYIIQYIIDNDIKDLIFNISFYIH